MLYLDGPLVINDDGTVPPPIPRPLLCAYPLALMAPSPPQPLPWFRPLGSISDTRARSRVLSGFISSLPPSRFIPCLPPSTSPCISPTNAHSPPNARRPPQGGTPLHAQLIAPTRSARKKKGRGERLAEKPEEPAEKESGTSSGQRARGEWNKRKPDHAHSQNARKMTQTPAGPGLSPDPHPLESQPTAPAHHHSH